MSRLSHRSHDNLGYVASPLIEDYAAGSSSIKDSDENGRKAYSARAAFYMPDEDDEEEEEGEAVLVADSSEGEEFEEDFLDDS